MHFTHVGNMSEIHFTTVRNRGEMIFVHFTPVKSSFHPCKTIMVFLHAARAGAAADQHGLPLRERCEQYSMGSADISNGFPSTLLSNDFPLGGSES